MSDVLRKESPWLGLMVVAAAIVGVGLWVSPLLLLAAAPVPILFAALVLRPTLAVPFLFVAILISDRFTLGISIGVPLTISKFSMLLVMFSWLGTCMIRQQWPLRPHPVWPPLIATTLVLLVGLVYVRTIERNSVDLTIGFTMLVVLVVVVEALVEGRHLWGSLRIVAWSYIVVVTASIVFGTELDAFGQTRALGFGANPNQWAAMVLIGLGPTVAILDNEGSRISQLGQIAALVVAAVAVMMTVSRAGILGYVAAMPFVAAIMWNRRLVLLMGLSVAVAGVFLFVDLGAVWMRFDSFVDSSEFELDGSVRDRGLALRFALQEFSSSPLIGIGTGGFFHEVEVSSGGQVEMETHNSYLQILAETGLIGFGIFAWAVSYFVRSLFRSFKAQKSPRFRRLILGFGASITNFLLTLATMNGITLTLAFLILALVLVMERLSRLPEEQLREYGLA